ncbi:MAG: M20/M25/M40 family metallo-hydrolase [Candidatus Promineifilaceae bacterium]
MDQSELISGLETHVQASLPRHLELLRQMVAINSFTANPVGVNELGSLTIEAFADLGFSAERVQAADFSYGQHLVLTRRAPSANGHGAAPQIGLISHLDTVYPAGEEVENDFSWRVSGRKIYGPGVYDIKGGTVMIHLMLSAIEEVAPWLYNSVTWIVLLNAAEEALVPDFGKLCVERLAGDTLAALVFEGGEAELDGENSSHLVVNRKGMARFRLSVEGRAAHAGTAHDQGANAILQLADVIRRLAALTNYDEQVTLNVGTIAGGTVINRVPHQASASLEMRAYSPQIFRETLEKIMAFDGYSSVSSGADGYPCRVHVEVLGVWEPWGPNSGSDGLLQTWDLAGRPLGIHVLPQSRGGLSDGNWTWQHIPTVDGLGPQGGNAHCSERSADGSKEQEFILPDSYATKALLNILSVLHLIGERVRPGMAAP